MYEQLILLILLPLAGTVFGSAGVFFMKKASYKLQKSLSGFAAGVMTAACIWSLIIPSIEDRAGLGKLAFLPALVGLLSGVLLLLLLDRRVSRMKDKTENKNSALYSEYMMTFLAVTIHNFPEGLAVGMMCAPIAAQEGENYASALIFSLAIALQNIPEGAIISLPMYNLGANRKKAFLYGTASGAVEPIGALVTLAITKYVTAALPYLFGFAAGTMLFVVADELIEKREKTDSLPLPALCFCFGFALMMVLDVAFG